VDLRRSRRRKGNNVDERFAVLAFGAHPDDLEVAMGVTAAKLSGKGLTALFVDLCDGEPTRHASRGARQAQAGDAAQILGVKRLTLNFQDRLITDTLEARLVKTEKETLEVHVGPTAYLTEKGITLAKGDTLEILGSRVTIDKEPVVIAKQIKKGDNTWTLRDASGRPMWSGRGR
jgi:LmbE family N-acetylglucosaminyl deacetylase